jgi:ribosomal protein L37AE/L43A
MSEKKATVRGSARNHAITETFSFPSTPQLPLPKCRHGVYLASPQEIRTRQAFCCSFCNPHFDDSFLRPRIERRAEAFLVVPRSLATGELRANRHDPSRCPECDSNIHYVEKTCWRCAECGHNWKGRAAA